MQESDCEEISGGVFYESVSVITNKKLSQDKIITLYDDDSDLISTSTFGISIDYKYENFVANGYKSVYFYNRGTIEINQMCSFINGENFFNYGTLKLNQYSLGQLRNYTVNYGTIYIGYSAFMSIGDVVLFRNEGHIICRGKLHITDKTTLLIDFINSGEINVNYECIVDCPFTNTGIINVNGVLIINALITGGTISITDGDIQCNHDITPDKLIFSVTLNPYNESRPSCSLSVNVLCDTLILNDNAHVGINNNFKSNKNVTIGVNSGITNNGLFESSIETIIDGKYVNNGESIFNTLILNGSIQINKGTMKCNTIVFGRDCNVNVIGTLDLQQMSDINGTILIGISGTLNIDSETVNIIGKIIVYGTLNISCKTCNITDIECRGIVNFQSGEYEINKMHVYHGTINNHANILIKSLTLETKFCTFINFGSCSATTCTNKGIIRSFSKFTSGGITNNGIVIVHKFGLFFGAITNNNETFVFGEYNGSATNKQLTLERGGSIKGTSNYKLGATLA